MSRYETSTRGLATAFDEPAHRGRLQEPPPERQQHDQPAYSSAKPARSKPGSTLWRRSSQRDSGGRRRGGETARQQARQRQRAAVAQALYCCACRSGRTRRRRRSGSSAAVQPPKVSSMVNRLILGTASRSAPPPWRRSGGRSCAPRSPPLRGCRGIPGRPGRPRACPSCRPPCPPPPPAARPGCWSAGDDVELVGAELFSRWASFSQASSTSPMPRSAKVTVERAPVSSTGTLANKLADELRAAWRRCPPFLAQSRRPPGSPSVRRRKSWVGCHHRDAGATDRPNRMPFQLLMHQEDVGAGVGRCCGASFASRAQQPGAFGESSMVVAGQRQRHHVGVEAVDDRKRLLAAAAMALLDGDVVARLASFQYAAKALLGRRAARGS